MTSLGIVGVILVLCPGMLASTMAILVTRQPRTRPTKPMSAEDYCLVFIILLWTTASLIGGIELAFP